MNYDRPAFWIVEFFPEVGEKKSPDQYVRDLEKKERAAIRRQLITLSSIRIPREWPNTKLFEHDGLRFYQLTVGRHRLYLYLDTEVRGVNKIIVCYACPKKSQKAKKIDKNRAVTSIRNYMRGKGQ